MEKASILVVEDDTITLEFVRVCLSKEGFDVTCCKTGVDALSKLKKLRPDLIVLDIMLPDINGMDICKTVKSNEATKHIPIVMLTLKGDESDIVNGLEQGADDYILKPFSPKIFVARINTVLRRNHSEVAEEATLIKVHDLVIDTERREIIVGDKLVKLTHIESLVLLLLAKKQGKSFSRAEIVEAVWGKSFPVADRSVDVQVVSLRKKLGPLSYYIETIRSFGYRFTENPN